MVRKFKTRTLPKGVWIDKREYVYVRIFHQGKQIIKYVGPTTQPQVIDDAIILLNRLREKVRLGISDVGERHQRITIEQACEIYWKLHAVTLKAPRQQKYYLGYLKKFFAGRHLDTITYVDVQRYRAIREKTVKPSTVNKEHAVITSLFNKMKEWKRMGAIKPVRLPEDNPGSLVKKANERGYARKRVLSVEEFDRLMETAPLKIKRICLGAINTTLRKCDLEDLTKANVIWETNVLEGTQSKTGKPYCVPINKITKKLIETADGHKIFDFTNFRRAFVATQKRAGIDYFQFRDLRRTGSRWMIKKGVDLATVSEILGHASITTTQAYVGTVRDDRQKAVEALGTIFETAAKTAATPLSVENHKSQNKL